MKFGPPPYRGRGQKKTDAQTDRRTDEQPYRQTDRRTDRQTDRQTYRQTDRQTDRRTDRQTDRQKDRQTGTDRSFMTVQPQVAPPARQPLQPRQPINTQRDTDPSTAQARHLRELSDRLPEGVPVTNPDKGKRTRARLLMSVLLLRFLALSVIVTPSLSQSSTCFSSGVAGDCSSFVTQFCTNIAKDSIGIGNTASQCFNNPGKPFKCVLAYAHLDANLCPPRVAKGWLREEASSSNAFEFEFGSATSIIEFWSQRRHFWGGGMTQRQRGAGKLAKMKREEKDTNSGGEN
ncbi:hypothetical protein B0H19DRAFT_1317801 [Mycena capillaripes]|nr:hypothetical protein B0H19DRAFT_1317801 [Mycena capillaripes]